MEAGQLFVNMQYPAIDEMRAQLEAEYADAGDPEMMRALVKQHADRTMILRVGRTVVYALAKQLNKEWDQRALEVAASPESLSMHLPTDEIDPGEQADRAVTFVFVIARKTRMITGLLTPRSRFWTAVLISDSI